MFEKPSASVSAVTRSCGFVPSSSPTTRPPTIR
uniref:Uncharacterized protein n=1 Tax=Anopheles christyi TaxID=43041 RepID=A0A182KHT0_9DIPT